MKMNRLILTGVLSIGLLLTSCGSDTKTAPSAENSTAESTPPNADKGAIEKFNIDTERSVIVWKGSILKVKDHTGTLKFKSGGVKIKGNKVLGGGLVVDMSTMTATDANYDAKSTKEGLIGHLQSDAFFYTEKFGEAKLSFKDPGTVALSIRDKNHKESYTDVTVSEEKGKKVVKAKMIFDRQKYGVAFLGSSKDFFISDKIELDVTLYMR
jgi:polyisoprenoid-binding protein YceI